jgi:hypothetical protein
MEENAMVLSEKTSQPALVPGDLAELRNVERTSRTCQTCAVPVRGFVRCWRCSEHQTISGLADIVAPLIYAVAGTELAAVLSAYKNHPIRTRREHAATVVGALLRSALEAHEGCFGSLDETHSSTSGRDDERIINGSPHR